MPTHWPMYCSEVVTNSAKMRNFEFVSDKYGGDAKNGEMISGIKETH
jgi:hypothetical protein